MSKQIPRSRFEVEDTGFAEFAVWMYPAAGGQRRFRYKSRSKERADGVAEFLKLQEAQRELGIEQPE